MGTAFEHPVDAGADRDAEGEADQRDECSQDGDGARPSRWRWMVRCASAPVRTTRPLLRAAKSPVSTMMPSTTRTSERAHAAGRLNEMLLSVKISVVNVW